VIDPMLHVPDAASIATMRWLETILGRKCGGLTGTNVYGALTLLAQMMKNKEQGSG
jgi:cysteine synthase A